MNRLLYLLAGVVVGAVLAVPLYLNLKPPGLVRASGARFSPFVLPTNTSPIPSASPPNPDCILLTNPSAVGVPMVELHLGLQFYNNLTLDASKCMVTMHPTSGAPRAKLCIRSALLASNTEQNPSDLTNKQGSPYTPFDVDVSGTTVNTTTAPIWVVFEVVLHRLKTAPDLDFIRASKGDVSADAVRVETAYQSYFSCRGPIEPDTDYALGDDDAEHLRFLMQVNPYNASTKIVIAPGFNIGVTLKAGNIEIPIYIDPKTPNNG